MKTYLTYGFLLALANAILTLIFYLLGFHSDPEKLRLAQIVAAIASPVITITGLVLGMRARRAAAPATEEFSYGRALGAGMMVTLFAALFGTIFYYVYLRFINPDFTDVIMQAETAKLEAKGVSGAKLEQAQNFMRMFLQPGMQIVVGFIGTVIWGTVISLVAAAFVKRPALPPATPVTPAA
ncbi:MAG TPA: DUF4199 domain-containing protein [Opitutaceae bacterium]|nr:DUF4199 domain-containing protein [Opitutaceae bacterium]